MSTFTPTINICPTLNTDGTYNLKLSAYELNEIMKGIRILERQRESNRKYKDKFRTNPRQPNQVLSLNIIPPVSNVPAT